MNKVSKQLKDVYNQISQEFSASRVFPWEELQVFIPYIKDNFKILDLGCGNGRLLKSLEESNKKFDYTGIDFSEGLIKQAQENFPEHKFTVADMRELDFPENSFDMVFSIAAFHHLDKKSDRIKLLKKLNKCLKPGGYLFMTNWNLLQKKYFKDYLKYWWRKKSWNDFFVSWSKYSGDNKKHWRYYHSFTKAELEKLLEKTGFELQPKGVYHTKWNINCFVKK
ncbi:methyltransferase domain-containing protein [bacterium]|jgi:alkylated DNA repair protein alkB family protein 8|nr:methyltransferase domain-containing protein [bacterium]